MVAYFGLPISPVAKAFAARRRDLRIVEDRAQALDCGAESVGAWTLYSPRKLLGVADGGVLVACDPAELPAQPEPFSDPLSVWGAALMRYEDPMGRRKLGMARGQPGQGRGYGGEWRAMTRLSLSLLSRTPLSSLAEARWPIGRCSTTICAKWSALPADPAAPPLGYVLRLAPDKRDALLGALHRDRIFAAVHWKEMQGRRARSPASGNGQESF